MRRNRHLQITNRNARDPSKPEPRCSSVLATSKLPSANLSRLGRDAKTVARKALRALCPTPNLRAQASRPRSGKGRSVARDACRDGREGISGTDAGLTFALAVVDLRDPRLWTLRFGFFRLRAKLARVRAKVKGLRASWKPLRMEPGPLRAKAGEVDAGVVALRARSGGRKRRCWASLRSAQPAKAPNRQRVMPGSADASPALPHAPRSAPPSALRPPSVHRRAGAWWRCRSRRRGRVRRRR